MSTLKRITTDDDTFSISKEELHHFIKNEYHTLDPGDQFDFLSILIKTHPQVQLPTEFLFNHFKETLPHTYSSFSFMNLILSNNQKQHLLFNREQLVELSHLCLEREILQRENSAICFFVNTLLTKNKTENLNFTRDDIVHFLQKGQFKPDLDVYSEWTTSMIAILHNHKENLNLTGQDLALLGNLHQDKKTLIQNPMTTYAFNGVKYSKEELLSSLDFYLLSQEIESKETIKNSSKNLKNSSLLL